MYKKGSKGWLKHFDFILLDMICLQIAFLLAYVIRHDNGSPYIVPLYRNMAIFMELLDIVVMFFYETLSNVLKRGYFREFAATVKHVLLVELFSVLYLFTMQEGQAYSRTALYLTGVIYAILTYIVRIIWKKFEENGAGVLSAGGEPAGSDLRALYREQPSREKHSCWESSKSQRKGAGRVAARIRWYG